MRKSLLAVAGLTLLLTSVGCGGSLVRVRRDFSQRERWTAYERVVVETRNGAVEIVGNAGGTEIDLSGTLQAGGLTLAEAEDNLDQLEVVAEPAPEDPRTFLVRFKYPDHLHNKGLGASFKLKLPEACHAEVNTGNGNVTIHAMRSARVRTSNGTVEGRDITGELDAESSNGMMYAQRVAGPVRLDTSNGRIVVREGGTSVYGRSSNGDVEVVGVTGDVDVVTSNGSIRLEGSPPPDARIVMSTSNGSITARLPETLAGRVSLRCSNGRVTADMGDASFTRPRMSKNVFEAEMNGGGSGEVVATTSNGSVTLTRLTEG